MGKNVKLTASDGHTFAAYRAEPKGQARAGLVVIQEIFGVNSHIRELCDGFAADGFAAVAPALFDRAEKGIELGYDADDMTRGREIRAKVGWDGPLLDIEAAAEALRPAGHVGVVGYCWGGSLAWLAACRLRFDAAVGYYGAQIIQFNDEEPRCPTLLHFGEKDAGIPLADVEAIRARHAGVPVHVYKDAQHGFSCDHRASYQEAAARIARERTLDFFAEHLG